MQYKVPQKIDLEDKVIGPLTLKQFIYLLAGGMIDYIIFSSSKSFFAWVLMILVAIVALSFAFVQIEEQPFSYLFFSFFSYILRPKIRLWDKRTHIEKTVELHNKKEEKPVGPVLKSPEEIHSALEALARVLDTHGWSPEQYKEEMDRYGIKSDLEERIKSSTEVKEELKLEKTKESEVDLMHSMSK